LIAACTGRDLARLFATGHGDRIAAQIAPSPEAAIERIEAASGAPLTEDGRGNAAIAELRAAVDAASTGVALANGLVISAPHTHWSLALPILIAFDGMAYRVAPAHPVADARYRPVSFVFADDGPLAYEWIDDSVVADDTDLAHVWAGIIAVNARVASANLPFGLSVNWRFKAILEPPSVATAELGSTTAATIVPEAALLPDPSRALAQVTWHAFTDVPRGWTVEQQALAEALRHLRTQPGGDGVFERLLQRASS
jgi:hypothetical protein